MQLRVSDFNFDTGILTVHDGKRKKDRTVPLPDRIFPELKNHLESAINLHQEDLANDYAGTFLPDLLERKYKHAAKELVWQWFFPAKMPTFIPDAGQSKKPKVLWICLESGMPWTFIQTGLSPDFINCLALSTA
ncbi:MAG: hypothetical protein SRB2_02810 [Desulfobacteraceae bacterium Eth-SRB2]|nr:MAG: hypothetical protein SRB2_02810 [Desulfobacteraceae bacterium Eth-SRB2]